jgi:oligopeptidase B
MNETYRLDRTAQPPTAKRVAHTHTRPFGSVDDPWHWLRDDTRKNEEVLDYLRAENSYTESVMAPLDEQVETLFQEQLSRIREDDETVPVHWGDFLYYSRTVKGAQYRIYCRKPFPDGDEEVILDANAEAKGLDYYRLGTFAISADHRMLAWSEDTTGGETYTIHVKRLDREERLPDRIEGASSAVEWANDNATLFYTTLDATHRPYRLYRHQLGAPTTDATLVYEEGDESFFLGLHKTRSDRFLVIHLGNNDTNEVHLLEADQPEEPFKLVSRRKKGVEYAVDHWGDKLLLHTNEGAVNFRLLEIPVDDPTDGARREVIAHRASTQLEQVEPFADFLAAVERCDGICRLRIYSMPDYEPHDVPFDEEAYTITVTQNPKYDTDTIRFVYESLVTPESWIDYNMRTRQRELLKVEEVLGGYDATCFVTRRIHATSADGTEVPITLVHRSDLPLDGTAPALLYGYGSYGSTHTDPAFHSSRLSLLERGFVFAIGHIRGGGDLGRPWYDDGKLEHKQHTFDDFIACADALCEQGYCARERLAIRGGSAGGLLVGTVINQRPDLCRAAIAKVPFVDVMNTMLDPTLPLTVIEYDEWGNPNEREPYERMLAYSPYDNVRAVRYPELLVTGGLTDPRVAYWEPAKWVAKLRATADQEGLILLKTEMGAGHGGPSGRYEALREVGFEYAFLLATLTAQADEKS